MIALAALLLAAFLLVANLGFRRIALEQAAELGELEARLEAANLELAELQFALEQASPPGLEDSPVWSASTPTIEGAVVNAASLRRDTDEALVRVLTLGEKLRCCAECGAYATNSAAIEYEWTGDHVRVLVNEKCQSCEGLFAFKLSPGDWACMEAMRAWEGCRTAAALFRSEVQNVNDLEALDGDA